MNEPYITLSSRAKDITGQRFGRLLALGPISREETGSVNWRCRCTCGNTVTVKGDRLRNGTTRSCGCLLRDANGADGVVLSNVWAGIKRRCLDINHEHYSHYGGRGITICGEWRDDFAAFERYMMTLPHACEPGYTVDRVDNSGDYAPGNVRWATMEQQGRNKRNNRLLTIGLKTLPVSEWAAISKVSRRTIENRLARG